MADASANIHKVDVKSRKRPPKQNGIIRWIQRLDVPFKAFGQLSVVALVLSFLGWLVGSIIQYNSWHVEHNLKRYETDLAEATKTFGDISDALSKAISLQQMVVFNYSEAIRLHSDDDQQVQFLWAQARFAAEQLREARTTLREAINVMVRRAEIYIDWPSVEDRRKAVHRALLDPLTITQVEAADVDCDKNIAAGDDISQWKSEPVFGKPDAPIVDWQSAKHHVIMMYACFDRDLVDSEPIRRWAASVESGQPLVPPKFTNPDKRSGEDLANSLTNHFHLQMMRLEKFMVLAMTRIDTIRRKNAPPGYTCYLIGWHCGSFSAPSATNGNRRTTEGLAESGLGPYATVHSSALAPASARTRASSAASSLAGPE